MKIYGFFNGFNPNCEAHGIAVTEDGRVVAMHTSSNESWSRHDLGMNGNSTWKHELYKEACPEGFEVEFVGHDQFDGHVGLQAALTLAENANETPC